VGDIITARAGLYALPESPPAEFINFFIENYKGAEARAKQLYNFFSAHYTQKKRMEADWMPLWRRWLAEDEARGKLERLPPPDNRNPKQKELDFFVSKILQVYNLSGTGKVDTECNNIFRRFQMEYGTVFPSPENLINEERKMLDDKISHKTILKIRETEREKIKEQIRNLFNKKHGAVNVY